VSQANAQNEPERAEKLRRELRARDHRDSTRTTAPLKAADDAVHIDSSTMSIEEVIARAEKIVEEKLKQRSFESSGA
jgi:cytidylate kinase